MAIVAHQDMIFLLFLLAFSLASAQRIPVGATVQTSSGAIIGRAARNRTQVSEYLGIPYAKPPVGALRFAEPQSYFSSMTVNASSYVSTIQTLRLQCRVTDHMNVRLVAVGDPMSVDLFVLRTGF